MKKFLRILENTALGIMVNGGFYIIMQGLDAKSLIVTAVSFYAMTVAIVFQED